VLAVVGGVDGGVRIGSGFGEGDVALHTAGADAADTAGLGASVPRVVRAVGGADVQLVAGADHPHRHVRAEAAVGAGGAELEFLGIADAAEFLDGPCGHRHVSRIDHQTDPTRTSDLMARRSSIAAYAS